jgi:4-hydroxybenzoate polyprenyltransferase
VTHPFPSVLDGLVAAGVATVAGSGAGHAAAIGLSMTLVQLGIGTVNDVVDAEHDRGRKPNKPVALGIVPGRRATIVAGLLFVMGLGLATALRPVLGVLTLVVIGIGLAYDLRLKGTSWSWLPFAVGIPILPVDGWLGATGTLDPLFAVIVPAAIAAGAALALANSLVDLERDRAAGASSAATSLGSTWSSRVVMGLLALIALLATGGAAVSGTSSVGVVAVGLVALVPILAAAGSAGSAAPGSREWAWRVEAVGLAVLAVIWLAVVVPVAAA